MSDGVGDDSDGSGGDDSDSSGGDDSDDDDEVSQRHVTMIEETRQGNVTVRA